MPTSSIFHDPIWQWVAWLWKEALQNIKIYFSSWCQGSPSINTWILCFGECCEVEIIMLTAWCSWVKEINSCNSFHSHTHAVRRSQNIPFNSMLCCSWPPVSTLTWLLVFLLHRIAPSCTPFLQHGSLISFMSKLWKCKNHSF